MARALTKATSVLKNKIIGHNRYTLNLATLMSSISVLSIKGEESLNQPWCYEVTFTSSNKTIAIDQVLSQSANLTFVPEQDNRLSEYLSSLALSKRDRTLYGIITEFSQLSVNKDEAHYRVTLKPRLALLANHHYSAIYQNQSVVSVVEEVLRRHGFTGVDYRLELNSAYPPREFITQWQESDLEFIQRILADVGIWFRFESHAEHGCDVLILSDYEQGYENAGSQPNNQPSGTLDAGTTSVWDLALHSKTVKSSVLVQDYNYRQAQADLQAQVDTRQKESITHGVDYRYGEHYKDAGNEEITESGRWYAKIRHQQHISEQIIIHGKSNDYHLSPGQRIQIEGSPIQAISEGIIILTTQSQGDRSKSYEIDFTAIPFDVLKPYRPTLIPWRQISGTLPARVTSPDNDVYGYIDTQGRYRVKFDFDLKRWKSGEESLWVRLAKPYAGETYGFHFPLIDGTEVAIAFTEGNPDRPYIAHAMHDSSHSDHVTTVNKHRNVIRTPANNKLRMDDKRGQEHIKLATEYGKTQLNLGHLVDSEKYQRGEGFELRTDEWGSIAANKGLYLTSQTQPKAEGKQLDMQGTISQLENALSIAKALQDTVQNSQAHPADTQSQQQLKSALTQLDQSGIIGYAQEGIGLTSPENIQLSTGNTMSIVAENHTDISALKKITLAAGDALSLFAQKMGIKLFAAKGKVEIQAQNDAMELAAKQDIKIDSVDGSVTIVASKEIILISGGSYIKINGGGIELGTSGNISFKCVAMQKMGATTIASTLPYLPGPTTEIARSFHFTDEQGQPYSNEEYIAYLPDGQQVFGVTDKEGKTQIFYTGESDTIKVQLKDLV